MHPAPKRPEKLGRSPRNSVPRAAAEGIEGTEEPGLLRRDTPLGHRLLPLEPPASVEIGIAVPSLEHCSPAAKSTEKGR